MKIIPTVSVPVPELLRRNNYEKWSFFMKHYLMSQDLWDVVQSSQEPDPEVLEKKREWERKNALALHVIRISCEAQVLDDEIKEFNDSAKAVWDKLASINPIKQHVVQMNVVSEPGDREKGPESNAVRELLDGLAMGKLTTVLTDCLEKASETNELLTKDKNGDTALSLAASNGRTDIAKLLVEKKRELLIVKDAKENIPVQLACERGYEKAARFLYRETPLEALDPERGGCGFDLLIECLNKKLFGIVLDLLHNFTSLDSQLRFSSPNVRTTILKLAQTSNSSFSYGIENRLGFLKQLIYNCIPVKTKLIKPKRYDSDSRKSGGINVLPDVGKPSEDTTDGVTRNVQADDDDDKYRRLFYPSNCNGRTVGFMITKVWETVIVRCLLLSIPFLIGIIFRIVTIVLASATVLVLYLSIWMRCPLIDDIDDFDIEDLLYKILGGLTWPFSKLLTMVFLFLVVVMKFLQLLYNLPVLLLWRLPRKLLKVLGLKQIYDLKLNYAYANKVLQLMCRQLSELDQNQLVEKGAVEATFLAIKNGIPEIAIEFIKANNNILWSQLDLEDDSRNIFALAVKERQEEVARYLYGSFHQIVANTIAFKDADENNILHVAAKLAPDAQLIQISSAAIQLQSELRWFKAVEDIFPPFFSELKNGYGETPSQVFVREHKSMLKEAEGWMKKTSESATVVGALIITIMFAATFTVPGGNDEDTGLPIFSGYSPFQIFLIFNAVSLAAASSSVLMFFGILTSRYAWEDFFKSLPLKLNIGLSLLFISIVTMMGAFSAAVFIMLQGQLQMVIPITLLANCPVIFFIMLQFPLLLEIFTSTFRLGIFQKNRPLIELLQKEISDIVDLSQAWTTRVKEQGSSTHSGIQGFFMVR